MHCRRRQSRSQHDPCRRCWRAGQLTRLGLAGMPKPPVFGSRRRARCPFTLSSSAWLSLVPRKFVPGVVPALPFRLHTPPPPTGSHTTVPSALTDLTAEPAAQVPLTRFCRAAESRSSLSAFRLATLTPEVDGQRWSARVDDRLQPRATAAVLPTTPRLPESAVRLPLHAGTTPVVSRPFPAYRVPLLTQALLADAGGGDAVRSDPVVATPRRPRRAGRGHLQHGSVQGSRSGSSAVATCFHLPEVEDAADSRAGEGGRGREDERGSATPESAERSFLIVRVIIVFVAFL